MAVAKVVEMKKKEPAFINVTMGMCIVEYVLAPVQFLFRGHTRNVLNVVTPSIAI